MANRFFAHPTLSVEGWERAIDAQARIVHEAEQVLARNFRGDVLFVGHGAVGTLLLCHYSDLPISRGHDQPEGGGNIFSFAQINRCVLSRWLSVEHGAAQPARDMNFVR
jgi:broad specificity phosphatase PhoE